MWKDRRQSQKPLGSLSQTPEKPLTPGLPAFLEGSFCGQWNFPKTGSSLLGWDSQFYLILSELGYPWGRGSDEEKRGLCPRGAGFSWNPLALRGKCSELGGACTGSLSITICFLPGWLDQLAWTLTLLLQSPGKGQGARGKGLLRASWSARAGPSPSCFLTSPRPPGEVRKRVT